MALVAEGVSFGRANIYNYFQNKDEVFLALLTRQHELWAADLTDIQEAVLRDLVNWDSEAIAQALAGSLNARIPMLKLLAASLPDMEQNSRHERLIELKRAYKAVLASPRALLHAAKPSWDEARIDRFAFSFMPFLHGVYPYAFHSKKQLAAMEDVGVPDPGLGVVDLVRSCAFKLLQDD